MTSLNYSNFSKVFEVLIWTHTHTHTSISTAYICFIGLSTPYDTKSVTLKVKDNDTTYIVVINFQNCNTVHLFDFSSLYSWVDLLSFVW